MAGFDLKRGFAPAGSLGHPVWRHRPAIVRAAGPGCRRNKATNL